MKHIIEGKIEGRVTGRRGIRRKQLPMILSKRENTGYLKMKRHIALRGEFVLEESMEVS